MKGEFLVYNIPTESRSDENWVGFKSLHEEKLFITAM
jgi:hypothetical protein